jgi:site-specific recombinase XerD
MIENNNIRDQYFRNLDELVSLKPNKAESVRERKHAVKIFVNYCNSQNISIPTIQVVDIENFAKYLVRAKKSDGSSYSAYTIQQRFALVRTFLKYCYKKSIIQTALDRLISDEVNTILPDIREKNIDYIPAEDILRLIDECKKPRDKAILALLYNSACRLSAIRNAKISNVDFENEIFYFYEQKTNKENFITLFDKTIKALQEYIEVRKDPSKPEDYDFLFTSREGTHLSLRSFQRIVNYWSNKILGKKMNVHLFRHMSITHMAEAGADPYELSRIASHSSMDTTLKYYKQSRTQRAKTMKSSHPLMQKKYLKQEELALRKKQRETLKREREARRKLSKLDQMITNFKEEFPED